MFKTDAEFGARRRVFKIMKILSKKMVGATIMVLLGICIGCCFLLEDFQNAIGAISICVSLIIAVITFYFTYTTCYRTLVDSNHSMDLEFKKDKISKIQQEFAYRFERLSPNEIVPYSLLKEIPTKEKVLEYIDNLQILYCKCSSLLVSANLLYSSDSRAKEFLKSYKDMIESFSLIIYYYVLTITAVQ